MSLNDPLSNVLSKIMAAEKKGRSEAIVRPTSKLIKKVLDLLKDNKYLGEYKELKEAKGKKLVVSLFGGINKVGVIKPRYGVSLDEYPKFEERYLPAHGFGLLVVSTNKGLMTHEEAIEKKLGGNLIAYVY